MKSYPAYYILMFLASMLFSGVALRAQSAIPIASNDNVTTTIFFPSNIAKVIPPAVNFNFQYEENARIGLLKGRKGKPSNLLVITEDGYAYSFALRYSDEIEQFNFILTTDQAVSHMNPTKTVPSVDVAISEEGDTGGLSVTTEIDSTSNEGQNPKVSDSNGVAPTAQVKLDNTTIDTLVQQNKDISQQTSEDNLGANEEDDLYDTDREEYYKIFCENNYLQRPEIIRVFRQSKKILLQLNNILVDRNEKYFVFQIENNSRKEFDLESVSFFRKTGVGQLQKIMTPSYTFNLQEKIDPDSINEIVLVFDNFTISSKEEIIVVLADVDYEKMVKLPLKNIIVNFPSN